MKNLNGLVVKTVHMHERDNAREHHTHAYELVHQEPPTPTLRRGQPFTLDVSFNRPFDASEDVVRLIFNFGENPNTVRGTRGTSIITSRDDDLQDLGAWDVRIIGSRAENLSIKVRSPVNSPVGVWHLMIETTTSGSYGPSIHSVDKDIYLLFNPWLKDDQVYMDDQKLLEEYVSNNTGKIWLGDEHSCRGTAWAFGQFEACILPACQLMLERSGIKDVFRRDPVRMSRAITRMVNVNDGDGGVIWGRWDGDYSDGTSPSAWTGSAPILKKYLKTKESVRYGQCWVFAAVTTTVCRALGIPSRVVTNVVSAHDTNASLSIDRFCKADGSDIESSDSIWNFHVWNEVWMARPDLPKGYGGWQAIDATPQETSDGIYQCGPASLIAIKEGAVGYNYDVPFLLSTVNADVMQWVEDKESDSRWRQVSSDKFHVGRMILTKAPFIFDARGERDREDITESYKYKEGTQGERATLYRAARSTDGAKGLYDIPDAAGEDVEFELVVLDRVNIGEPFALVVRIENKSREPRNVQAVLSVRSVYYNGVSAKLVKKSVGDMLLHPGDKEELRLVVSADEYMDKLVEYSMIKLCAICTVEETRQTWAQEDDFQVLKPKLDIEIKDRLIVGKPSDVVLSFTNPLKKNLTGCKFNYSGPGIKPNRSLPFIVIRPLESVRFRLSIVPQKAGTHHIVVAFSSEQLVDVRGSESVVIFA